MSFKTPINEETRMQLHSFLQKAWQSTAGFPPPDWVVEPGLLPPVNAPVEAIVPVSAPRWPVTVAEEPPPDSIRGNALGSTIDEIARSIAQCTRCNLARRRLRTVPGEGSLSPLVLVVGEAPEQEEEIIGDPFLSTGGRLLDKMLASISLSRQQNCFITYLTKCRSPEERKILEDEHRTCFPFLAAQIAVLKPQALLIFGNVTAQFLLATNGNLGRTRGRIFDYKGIPLMATYHPNYLHRMISKKKFAWQDLQVFRAMLRQVAPTYEADFAESLRRCLTLTCS
jgi:DNA polymerase